MHKIIIYKLKYYTLKIISNFTVNGHDADVQDTNAQQNIRTVCCLTTVQKYVCNRQYLFSTLLYRHLYYLFLSADTVLVF